MDSGCSNSMPFAAPCSEGLCAEGVCITTGGRCDQTTSKLCTVKVMSADGGLCSCAVWMDFYFTIEDENHVSVDISNR